MRVIVLGGDGYLGWPTAMNLSSYGHEVMVVDNYLRRTLCRSSNAEPLQMVPNLNERCALWKSESSNVIEPRIGDLADWDFLSGVFKEFKPDAVVHYAEQPSAPYSMRGRKEATLTLQNNLNATMNLVFCVREFAPDAHIIKLGTMGEYGTPDIDIEEGWIEIQHKGREGRFLFPRQASSLYHTTKIMDTDLLWFYVRTWGIRVTDLMQGPVYGLFTDENSENPELMSFFNYDETFGTVLNRFLVQAIAGVPLTIYGKGGQTRGYLNLKDTLNCVRLSLENPPGQSELRIFNQFTETFSVNELADKVVSAARQIGISTTTQNLENPRIEAEEHYYNPVHTGLLDLGLEPNYLTDAVLIQMLDYIKSRKEHINVASIIQNIRFR